MDPMAIMLMLLAMAIWAYVAGGDLEASERLEWSVVGLMLNGAAMSLWNLGLGPAAMLLRWSHYVVAAAAAVLILHIGARLQRSVDLQPLLPPVAPIALTLTVALLSLPSVDAA